MRGKFTNGAIESGQVLPVSRRLEVVGRSRGKCSASGEQQKHAESHSKKETMNHPNQDSVFA